MRWEQDLNSSIGTKIDSIGIKNSRAKHAMGKGGKPFGNHGTKTVGAANKTHHQSGS